MPDPTIGNWQSAIGNPVDALIVGAGPAGSTVATLLARRGWNTLLVERSPWPREKTCGGCLNASAVRQLRDLGLDSALHPATPIHHFHLTHPRAHPLHLDLPEGRAITRSDLDANLVTLAQKSGTKFLPETSAKLLTSLPAPPASPAHQVLLTSRTHSAQISARIILVADGIAGTFLSDQPWAHWHISPNSHFGISTLLPTTPPSIKPHTIHMCVDRIGHVGLVQLPTGQLHLGAALSPNHTRQSNGPSNLITQILQSAGHHIPLPAKLQATPLLTRRRKTLAHHRILILGDAAGYVEPFTGEGIAWAIHSARLAVSILPDSPIHWPRESPARFQALHNMHIRRRQRPCRLLRELLRHPHLAAAAFNLAHLLPTISRLTAQRISSPAFVNS